MFYSKQRGSALIVSVFIITVMAAFAAAMIRIDWSGQDMTSREVFATRAWFAAHSGNEYVLSKLFPLGGRKPLILMRVQKAAQVIVNHIMTLTPLYFSARK